MKSEIEKKIKEIIDEPFDVEKVDYIPELDNSKLTFGNKGLKFEATVLYIDMRDSTKILNNHNRTTIAKLHMAYFHTIVKIATELGGYVRSFNGDGMLVFFQGKTKGTLSNAVIAAMKMKYMLTNEDSNVYKKLNKYSALNFGIGIDDGEILCTKVGIAGTNNRDLVWIGNAVNKSVKIGDKLEEPDHIGISSYVYNNLTDEVKYHETTDIWGDKVKENIWEYDTFIYNDDYHEFYYTSYHYIVT